MSDNPGPNALSPESAKLIEAFEATVFKVGFVADLDVEEQLPWITRKNSVRAALEEHVRELEQELMRMREQYCLCMEAIRYVGGPALYEFNRYVGERSRQINAKYGWTTAAAPTERDG